MQNETPYGTTPTPNATPGTADQIKEKLQETAHTVREKATSAYGTVRQESCQLCDCASDGIRKNPIAAVVGAAFFGAAVCYLILEGRREATFRERYIDGPLANASDSVNTSLRSAYDNFKFW